MDFIRGTTLVHLKMRCWGGEKKASRDSDINVGQGGKLPPKKLLDLGRKKIFPPKALDPLMSKRKSAERACLANGTRFMGGFSVPNDEIDDLVTRLDDIKVKFQLELENFLVNFEDNKEAWISENSEFSHIIRNQVPDLDTIEKAFEFSYKLYKLEPVEGYEPDDNEVANQILHEIGLSCKEMSDRLLNRKRAINGNKLSEQFQPIIKKLDTLSFGNGRLLKVLNEFTAMQRALPSELIDHEHSSYGAVLTFLSMCSDSNKLEHIIEGTFSVTKLIEGMQKSKPDTVSSVPNLTSSPTIQPVKVNTSTAGAFF